MPTKIVELLRQGRKDDIWKRYCGFLDLSLEAFMKIQERLLMEQLHLAGRSELGKKMLGGATPTSVEAFRSTMPLTKYPDYEPYLTDKVEDVLPRKPYLWSHTSGRSGRYKMVPYSRETYTKAGEKNLAAVILSMAHERGEVCLEEKDVLLYNTPTPPYASGIALESLAEIFPFHFVPPMDDETAAMSFQERMEISFQMAMITGIDVIGSITAVLVKIGDRFAQGGGGAKPSRYLLHPKALGRLTRALLRSRLAGRPMLPKDLWSVKSAMCGGTDTALYKEKIAEYWGVMPYEVYSSTETGGTAAVQAWDKKGLYFFPDIVFLEFIPEQEWMKSRQDDSYQPKTVLLDEVQIDQRYELVITSFDGGPFLRYRMNDLIRFVARKDEDANIDLPSMIFAGRSQGLIDLAGFTGIMDEPMIWQAIHDTGIAYEDWIARKEISQEGAFLHLYLEVKENTPLNEVQKRINDNLRTLNPFYDDMVTMLEVEPLQVTLLSPGTYQAYFLEKQAAGADLAHLKPPHMNASDGITNDLLRLSENTA